MTRRIVIVNTGASTLKLAAVEVGEQGVREIRRIEQSWPAGEKTGASMQAALEQLDTVPDAFGHRVVHGGTEFVEPLTLTAEVEHRLEALVPLAPLHNASALAAIRQTRKLHANLPSVAVFDTAFHAHRPAVSKRYALPGDLVDRFALQRYGFHGIAHFSLVDALSRAQDIRVDAVDAVTLQLGAGCSACAVRNGRSIETSMGYTPLEGLVMTTRCGDVDPAIVLRLMRAGFGADRIENDLMRRSGLHALCGLSDMREILAAESGGNDDARFALELFCHRIILTVGAYFTLLGGDGALVFGGGIGTNSPQIRERIVRALGSWGCELDADWNARNEPGRISTQRSRPVFALQTNEEVVIARAVDRHLDPSFSQRD
jgi:acetate kinase